VNNGGRKSELLGSGTRGAVPKPGNTSEPAPALLLPGATLLPQSIPDPPAPTAKLEAMRLTVQVTLRARREHVWAELSTIAGTNRELAPFVRLTDPTHGARFDTDAWQGGARVSWQLLFGFIPVDRHRVDLVALPDGSGFRESSSSWWHRRWWHERTVLDDSGPDNPGGCVVRDSVESEHRLGVLDPIEARAVRQMFHRRHQSLQRRFG
jgi:hypothetical protein